MPEADDEIANAPVDRRLAALPFYVMAFFSGGAALIYEVAWAKMLSLTFGGTTQSTAAVVAGFMGGMGLGAWLYHVAGDRFRRPVLVYALLEFGIAASTALLTVIFYALPGIFAQLAIPDAAYTYVRFACVFVLLLGPSILIGATFPALCAVMIHSAGAVDRRLGWIYGINTIGAAVGVLVAGLVLLERFGLTGSVRVANAVNIGVGLAALILVRGALGRLGSPAPPPDDHAIPTSLPRVVTGIVLIGSGFCTLAYEILWFRALRYLVGTSAYAFAIILFTFLVGLGFGSLLLRRVARRASPERDLAWCQCAIAILALGAMAVQIALQTWPAIYENVSIFSGAVRYAPWWQRLLIDAGVAVATMLPATIFMGLSFPLATRLFIGDVSKLETRIGSAYLLANIGSIVGAVGGAAVLLPRFGTLGGTKAVAIVNLVLAGVIVGALRSAREGGRRVSPIPLAVSGAIVAAMVLLLPGAVPFRAEDVTDGVRGRVIFSEEGDLATVQVTAHPDDPAMRAMTIDGYKIGWSEAFRGTVFYRKQVLLAHLPMVLDRRIRRTLNIGLGSSATLETLAGYPQIERLDCVEISAAVVRGAAEFREAEVLADPRVNLHVDDAVHYLLRTDRTYDLIVSDGKQDPLYSGNAVLLSQDFYRYARDRLSADGMLVQWIPLGSLVFDFETTLRTFCDVFDHADVFYFPPAAVLMVGGPVALGERPRLPLPTYRSLPVGRELEEYLVPGPGALLAHWTAGKRQLENVIGAGPISTWDHLRLDFTPFKASTAEWVRAGPENLRLMLRAGQIPEAGAGPTFASEETPYVESVALIRGANLALLRGDRVRARALGERALRLNPEDPEAKFFLSTLGE